jgi:hypothetical protein
LECLARAVKQEEIQLAKVKLPLFEDDIILYLKTQKTPPKRLLDIINTPFSTVAGYKTNLQKPVDFLYIKKLRKNTGKLFHYYSFKKVKYLGINVQKK